ncbi:hypothetical protein MHU86_15758 [Fragilaria crotonensis]|nr:hypothetical protein MHU86_15758 [Fragilaria crotonensis]
MASTMTPQSSNLPSLEDVLRIYFQRLESMMECSHDILTVGRNLVKNLKRENASNTVIFHELSGLFPNVGCPLVQYHKVDNSYIAAQRSEHAVRREAREVATRADAEFVNKRQCIEAERKTQREQTLATNLTSPPCSTSNKVNRHQSAIRPGQYVLVSQDLSPGKFSHGGEAWVLAVHGSQGSMVCDVEYIKCTAGNRTRGEKAVPLSRLTLKNCAWHAAQLSCNKRGSKRLQEQMTTPPPEKQTSKDSKPLKDILSLACQSGMSNGWRAREMGFNACASKQNARFRDCFRRDLAELKGFLSAVPKIRMHSERGRDGSWKVRRQQHNPFTIKYLQYAWGVGVHYANNLVSLEHDVSVKGGITAAVKSSKCVIDNRAAARAWYTPQRLFIDKQVHVRHAEAEMLAYESRKAKNYEWTEEAKAEWVLLDASVKEEWIFHARNHDERQPYIRDQIIQAIQRSPTKSFDKIAADIDHWCSASTIHKWLSSHDSYSVYVERILPLLTRIQMQKHIDFAKLIRDHWGLNTRGKKFLWVHFDEKWFYGWLCCANAKKCEQLGLHLRVPKPSRLLDMKNQLSLI